MPQAGQDAISTEKPITECLKNMSDAGYICVYLNARSIVNKKNELNIMVEDIDPHIITITESWANTDITDAELGLTGYAMFRRDRKGRRGGGVILYVKDLTRFAIQAKGPDGKWTRKPLAYRKSNNVHLLRTRPPEICVNLVFKHIHVASSYTICRQFVPFIYCPL